MSPTLRLPLLLLPLSIPSALAWGTLGHQTVALIAQNYIRPSTQSWARSILGSNSSTYLADVSTWADSYRYTAAGTFSAPFHYIDAEDHPPGNCSVDYQRDCGKEGCSVSAIGNYTTRLRQNGLSSMDRLDALRFIVHIIGDLHQPLHDEAFAIGGNSVNVTFAGKKTNLHHIWDTEIPEKLIGGYSLDDSKRWATNLTSSISNGTYKAQSMSWLSGTNLSDPISTAMGWARDANGYVCTTVFKNGTGAYNDTELSGAYYQSSINVVEVQIAKAGYRLAAWLDLLASGKTALIKRTMGTDDDDFSYGFSDGDDGHGQFHIDYELPDGLNDFSRAKLARRAAGHRC